MTVGLLHLRSNDKHEEIQDFQEIQEMDFQEIQEMDFQEIQEMDFQMILVLDELEKLLEEL